MHKGFKFTEESKRKMSESRTGLKHWRAVEVTIEHESGERDCGCLSQLARKHGFHKENMIQRGHTKGWRIID